jgi:tRNA-specific adenosine deaminase 1
MSESVKRAFSADGRMMPVEGKTWRGGYAFHPFRVLSTAQEFAYSRRMVAGGISHISAISGPVGNECIIQGIIQGRTSTDPRKASIVCREQMWGMAKEVLEGLALPHLAGIRDTHLYSAVKWAEMLALRRQVKAETIEQALPGWIRNAIDDFPI